MIRLSESEMRNGTKEVLESFEHWSRRIINDKFVEKYGSDYFNYKLANGENLIKKDILRLVEDRMNDNPIRFPRKIDAILMEDIAYFFCKDNFYQEFFKSILERDFSGQDEVKDIKQSIFKTSKYSIEVYHGNALLLKESAIEEQLLRIMIRCYDCQYNYFKAIQ